MQMQQIRYFLALCEERNFTRAARRCGVSQPSLTNAMIALERELGGAHYDTPNRRWTTATIASRTASPWTKTSLFQNRSTSYPLPRKTAVRASSRGEPWCPPSNSTISIASRQAKSAIDGSTLC